MQGEFQHNQAPHRNNLHNLSGGSGRAAALPTTCSARTAARCARCIASRYDRKIAHLIPARRRSFSLCDDIHPQVAVLHGMVVDESMVIAGVHDLALLKDVVTCRQLAAYFQILFDQYDRHAG